MDFQHLLQVCSSSVKSTRPQCIWQQACTALFLGLLVSTSVHAAVLPVSTRPGVGAMPYQSGSVKGVTFRTWAPNAQAVSVAASFNFWSNTTHQLSSEGNGYWSGDVVNAPSSAQYKFAIKIAGAYQQKADPRSRQLVNSVGSSIVVDPAAYTWTNTDFQIPNWNELVIYEMHLGTFHVPSGTTAPANFAEATDRLDDLRDLGINCIELMPVNEFPGDISWGYNPSFPCSVESAYGGVNEMKKFIDACHSRGIAVVHDVVFNHWGPSDLSMWRYDGWYQNNLGGIYFFSDTVQASTPWGPRPDFGRTEVREFIRDSAMQWLNEFRMDGLRWDATKFMRRTDIGGVDIPTGWSLLQWCNDAIDLPFSGKISIAEDFDDDAVITRTTAAGGAGFDSQWDSFVHTIRSVVSPSSDSLRDMNTVRDLIQKSYNGQHTQRVIFTESHDEVAQNNGKLRVPSLISSSTPGGWAARKRSTLAAGVMFFSPGIPMIFMGQEFLESGSWDANVPLDWGKETTYSSIRQMYKDMIALRRNAGGVTCGLTGANTNVHHVNNWNKVIAWHRFAEGGPGDDVMVVANFGGFPLSNYRIGLPQSGTWHCRFHGDSTAYSSDFANVGGSDIEASGSSYDGLPASGVFALGPYSIAVYSQGEGGTGNPADLDGNCVVDSGDVALILLDIGSADVPADLDGDGFVSTSDVGLLLLDFGWTCPLPVEMQALMALPYIRIEFE